MSSVPTPMDVSKRRRFSSWWIFGIGLVAFAIYLIVPKILTHVMFLEEQAIADAQLLDYFRAKASTDEKFQEAIADGSLSLRTANSDPRAPAGYNAEHAFLISDTNKSGMLEGDEITLRLQLRLVSLDKNEDGAISKEEFINGMKMPETIQPTLE